MALAAGRWLQVERQFVPLLITTLLPILLLPNTANGDGQSRWLLFLLLGLIVVQCLRSLPALSTRSGAKGWALGFRLVGGLSLLTTLVYVRLGEASPEVFKTMLLAQALFFLMSSVRLIMLLARVPHVNELVMAGAAAGYILLGLTGGVLATTTQAFVPNAFLLGVGTSPQLLLDRMTYFSFVTLAGLGYGDVLPGNAFGERFAILLSVSGTLYVVLLVGLLLGRYIASEEVRFLELEEEETKRRDPQDQ